MRRPPFRSLLRAGLALALLLALSGCADYQALEQQIRIEVVNDSDEPQQVLVEVTRNGTEVLREGRALRAGDSWELAVPLEPLERGGYELRASTDAGGLQTTPFDVPVAGQKSAYLQVEIGQGGSITLRTIVPE